MNYSTGWQVIRGSFYAALSVWVFCFFSDGPQGSSSGVCILWEDSSEPLRWILSDILRIRPRFAILENNASTVLVVGFITSRHFSFKILFV